jgi:hypothetical protein
MKRFANVKDLKRLRFLNKPTQVADLSEEMAEQYEDRWLLKAEKMETKRIRAWRHQLAG